MKVLLLGEYSGFYTNLKYGLQELGVDVMLASNGDGWKKIQGADMSLFKINSSDSKFKKAYSRLAIPIMDRRIFSGYDVVQSVHEEIFHPIINSYMMKNMKQNNGKLFVNVCGNTNTLYHTWEKGILKYYTYDDNNIDKYRKYISNNPMDILRRKTELYVDRIADGIIPTAYEYAIGVRNYENCRQSIQLPFDASKVTYRDNKVKKKLVFYHGISRENDKGTSYIREAFDIIKKKYPNDVEVIMSERMPLEEYLNVLQKTNVLVDFCKEHFWGLNACYGMAEGKVVMSGASRKSLQEYNLEESPIVHIMPDTCQIVKQMEYLIENRNMIEEMGAKSRAFVEKFHNHIEVAQKYISVWKE